MMINQTAAFIGDLPEGFSRTCTKNDGKGYKHCHLHNEFHINSHLICTLIFQYADIVTGISLL